MIMIVNVKIRATNVITVVLLEKIRWCGYAIVETHQNIVFNVIVGVLGLDRVPILEFISTIVFVLLLSVVFVVVCPLYDTLILFLGNAFTHRTYKRVDASFFIKLV